MAHFEIAYFPKETAVIEKFEKRLSQSEELKRDVETVLENSGIYSTKVYIRKTGQGRGGKKLSDMFEGFTYKKFQGKVRGKKKGLLGEKIWKNDFHIYLLRGKNKDAILFSTEEAGSEAREIGSSIHGRLLMSVARQGLIPWSQIIRTGPVE